MAQEKIVQTAGRDQLGEFAPKFAELNDDVLFGEVWSRTDKLGLRDRSLVTITSLISQGITDNSLTYHLQSAKSNGITRTEIAEIITHIGFYAGWPKAWAAFRLAKDVWAEETAGEDAKSAFQREMIFPIGEPNTAYAKYFTGNSYLASVSVLIDIAVGGRHGDRHRRTTKTGYEQRKIKQQNTGSLFFGDGNDSTSCRKTGGCYERRALCDCACTILYECRPRLERQTVAQFGRDERPEVATSNQEQKGKHRRLRYHLHRLSHLVGPRTAHYQYVH